MKTKIVVISDTHCRSWEEIDSQIRRTLESADIVVHCGDFVGTDVVSKFRSLKNSPVLVHGNSDPVEIRKILPYIETFSVGTFDFGVIHPAWGGPEFDPQELLKDFVKKPNIILFGHTHEPLDKTIENVRYINPGQGYKSFMVPCTIAKITIDNSKISVEIMYF